MDLVVDGRRVHAGTGGAPFDPARPCIVFVHGAGLDHTIWALPARYFAQTGRAVLALDLPGHGDSEGPPLTGIAAMADWLIAALDAADVETAAVVGFSMGSAVALETARRAPGRVRRLALIGAAPRMPVHPDLMAAAAADHRAIEMMADWCHGPTGHVGGQPSPGMWIMGGTLRLLERAAPGVLHADLAACDDFAAETRGIACPVLLIGGARDVMTPPRGARALADGLAEAEIVVLPDCGHMVLSERPNAMLDALRRAL